MAAIAAADLLAAWEQARSSSPAQRAAVILRAFSIEEQPSVGARDAALLNVYAENFGHHLDGLASCPACTTEVELSVPVVELTAGIPAAGAVDPLTVEGHTIDWRLPNDSDLAAAADCEDAEHAALLLLSRCVVHADCAATELPALVREQLSERIAAADPGADISFDLVCPACGTEWESALDIAEFVWARLQSWAQRLLGEVDQLARAYGWSEAQILALSQDRRDTYVELVRGG